MYSGVCFCCTEQNSDYGWLEMSRYFFFFGKIQTHMASISHLHATTNDAVAAADAAAG